jgi:hypothetical protein
MTFRMSLQAHSPLTAFLLRPAVLVAGLLCLVMVPGARADDALGSLLARLGARPHAHATFTETQTLSLLKRPLQSSGELSFTPPDRLEKRTLLPKSESLLVEQDTLVLRRGKRQMTVQLSQYPQLAPLVEGIRATLAGDRAVLERVFEVELAGTEADWSLALVPRDQELVKIVPRLAISGHDGEVQVVETVRANGDRSVMRITPQAAP